MSAPLLLLVLLSQVSLGQADAAGCAHELVLEGKTLGGGPRTFCIRQALPVRLDGEALLAVRVDAPHRFEVGVRSRVFLYRVVEGRLTPRFLGSGFSSREVTGLVALDGALGIETLSRTGERGKLRCVFDGFPLVCSELAPD